MKEKHRIAERLYNMLGENFNLHHNKRTMPLQYCKYKRKIEEDYAQELTGRMSLRAASLNI